MKKDGLTVKTEGNLAQRYLFFLVQHRLITNILGRFVLSHTSKLRAGFWRLCSMIRASQRARTWRAHGSSRKGIIDLNGRTQFQR